MRMTDKSKDPKGKPKPKKIIKVDPFVQYGTMFKLESRSCPRMSVDLKPRRLQCVNCACFLEWRIYTLAPEKFDSVCHFCHMTARRFWAHKTSKELESNGKSPGVT